MTSFILLMAVMMIPQSSSASDLSNTISNVKEKKVKKKKVKKPFVWVLPKLTVSEDINNYLLTCDTLYHRINTYRDSVRYFSVRRAATGDMDDAGKPIYMHQIIDHNGAIRSSGDAFKQTLEVILTGMGLLTDGISLGTQTITATMALPDLGLAAFSYAKHVKAGPKIIGMGAQEVKLIIDKLKIQKDALKKLKESSTNTAENKNVIMLSSESPDGIDYIEVMPEEITDAVANMSDEQKEKLMSEDSDDLFEDM